MKRFYSIDSVKFFAILSVLTIHSGLFWNYSVSGNSFFGLALTLNSLARFAVPFFFVAAGFLFTLKSEQKGVWSYFKKYAVRIAIPYAIWSVIYLFNGVYFSDLGIKDYFFEVFSIRDFFYFGKDISEPLWFLPGLLISISITALAIKYKFLKILVPIALILNILGLFGEAQSYSMFWYLRHFSRDPLFFGLFYVSLGALLAKDNNYLNVVKGRRRWFLLSFVFLLLMLVERHILTELSMRKLYGDFYIFSIPLTISILFGCLTNPDMGKGLILPTLGVGALGIYLIHSLVLQWLNELLFFMVGDTLFSKLWWNLLIVPVVFVLSWFLYYTVPGQVKARLKRS